MSANLPSNAKLLVISDTGVLRNDKETYGFGPVVKELDKLYFFDTIIWICFNRPDQINNKSYLKIDDKHIKVIALKKTGGPRILDKIMILLYYPKYIFVICRAILKTKYIHVRAPSNPAVIAMFLSLFFPDKKFWFKYAGDWTGQASYFYIQQRKWLKRLKKNSKITVNGFWENQPNNVIAFENPCLDDKDRENGHISIHNKPQFASRNYCFVGGLNKNKGCNLFLQVLALASANEYSKIGTVHIVGDGDLRETLEALALKINLPIIFHGTISKERLAEIYKTSHFIVLPSRSEGFPKVIAEGTNYGCVPIVSNISCLDQYIQNGRNGFLIEDINEQGVSESLKMSFTISESEFNNMIRMNYDLARIFTYEHYRTRVLEEIYN